jgi:hypothetical protein
MVGTKGTHVSLSLVLAAVVTLSAIACVELAGAPAGASAATGSIAGTARDAVTGLPVSGVDVQVLHLESNGGELGPSFVADKVTGADGRYRVTLPPSGASGYWVCFSTDLLGPYEFQCWADQSTFFFPFPDPFGFVQLPPKSRTVHLAAGEHVSGIDGDLIVPSDPGSPSTTGSVTGRVTAADTGVRIGNVTVTAFNSAGLPVGHAVTSPDGSYELDNLAPSSGDSVCVDGTNARIGGSASAFHGRCFTAARWRAGAPPSPGATPVSVAVGVTTRQVNVALLPGTGG